MHYYQAIFFQANNNWTVCEFSFFKFSARLKCSADSMYFLGYSVSKLSFNWFESCANSGFLCRCFFDWISVNIYIHTPIWIFIFRCFTSIFSTVDWRVEKTKLRVRFESTLISPSTQNKTISLWTFWFTGAVQKSGCKSCRQASFTAFPTHCCPPISPSTLSTTSCPRLLKKEDSINSGRG